MQSAERQTIYRWGFVWSGVLVAAAGFVLLGVSISRTGAWGEVASALGLSVMGWGSLLQALNALSLTPAQLALEQPLAVGGSRYLVAGVLAWLAGWGLMAAGIRRAPATTAGPSPAAGAPLYPRLAGYRDFYWSTLGAYGGGVLLAEMVLILLQTLLSSGVQLAEAGRRRSLGPPAGAPVGLRRRAPGGLRRGLHLGGHRRGARAAAVAARGHHRRLLPGPAHPHRAHADGAGAGAPARAGPQAARGDVRGGPARAAPSWATGWSSGSWC